jgi:hypothetical protein
MGRRIGLLWVGLWLLASCLFNVASLRLVIRDAFWLFAGLYAGLDRWRDTQFLLAIIFVLWVIVLLVRGARLGHTLAVVLLLGSCCTIVVQLLFDLIFTLQGTPHYPQPLGWAVIGVFVLLNLVCLRALVIRKAA